MKRTFEPMLAARQATNIKFPVYASPKYDGVRAVVKNGQVLSRKLKPIPNLYLHELFGSHEHFDGELICGSPTAKDVFRKTTSGVMSQDGYPDVDFYVFDWFGDPDLPFDQRLGKIYDAEFYPRIKVVVQQRIENQEQLDNYENRIVSEGYEGVMIRSPNGPYKFGRSTEREGYLVKIKRFDTSVAVVTGFEELMRNNNPQQTNELGRSKRSNHQENMTPMNTLGALIARDEESDVEVRLGSGFTDRVREMIWQNKSHFHGAKVRYKFFPVGIKDKPRHPIFLEFL